VLNRLNELSLLDVRDVSCPGPMGTIDSLLPTDESNEKKKEGHLV